MQAVQRLKENSFRLLSTKSGQTFQNFDLFVVWSEKAVRFNLSKIWQNL